MNELKTIEIEIKRVKNAIQNLRRSFKSTKRQPHNLSSRIRQNLVSEQIALKELTAERDSLRLGQGRKS